MHNTACSLDVSRGCLSIIFGSIELENAGKVSEIVLSLPHAHYPYDLTKGSRGFISDLMVLERLVLSVPFELILKHLQKFQSGIEITKISRERGSFLISGRRNSFYFTLRAEILPQTGSSHTGSPAFTVSIRDFRIYGNPDRPFLSLASDILDLIPEKHVISRGVSHAAVSPLKDIVRIILPAAGFKIPLITGVAAASCIVNENEIEFIFERGNTLQAEQREILDLSRISDVSERQRIKKTFDDLEGKIGHEKIEISLCSGNYRDALKNLLDSEAKQGKSDYLTERAIIASVSDPALSDECETRCMDVLREKPDSIIAMTAISNLYIREGKTVEAVKYLSELCHLFRVREENEDFKHASLMLAGIQKDHDIESCMQTMNSLVSSFPTDPRVLLAAVKIFESAGRKEDSLKLKKRYVFLSQDMTEAFRQIMEITDCTGQSDSTEKFLREITGSIEEGSFAGEAKQLLVCCLLRLAELKIIFGIEKETAANLIMRALSIDPCSTTGLELLVSTASIPEEYYRAVKLHEAAIQTVHDEMIAAGIAVSAGKILTEKLHLPFEAIPFFEFAFSIRTSDFNLMDMLKNLYLSQNLHRKAVSLVLKFAENEPSLEKKTSLFHEAGRISEFHLQDHKQALNYYRKVMEINPVFINALEGIERIDDQNEIELLSTALRRLLTVDPDREKMKKRAMKLAGMLKDTETPEDEINSVLLAGGITKLQTTDSGTKISEKTDKPAVHEEEIPVTDCENIRRLLNMGKNEEAEKELREILKNDPDHTEAIDLISEIYEKKEKWNELAQVSEKRLELTFDSDELIKRLVKLAEIEGKHLNLHKSAFAHASRASLLKPERKKLFDAAARIAKNASLNEEFLDFLYKRIEILLEQMKESDAETGRELKVLISRSYERAGELFIQKNDGEAMNLFELSVQFFSENINSLKYLLEIYKRKNDAEGIERISEKLKV
jgi:tetratricopeptide (TPR) repeat protein